MHLYLGMSLSRIPRLVAAAMLFVMATHLTLAPAAAQKEVEAGLLVYHQITSLEGHYTVGTPEISADGSRIVFSDPAGSSEPDTPNRILVINADGTGLTEVDSYLPLCGCGAIVDISADGAVIASTDGIQVRVVEGGSAREVLKQTSGEITGFRLTNDGKWIVLLFRRDTATVDGTAIERGVWKINVATGEMSPIVVATDLVAFFNLPTPYGCCLPGDVSPLDVTDDGSQIVFDAYGADGEYLLGVDSDGGNLHQIAGPFAYLLDAAISGDGSTVAYDGIQPNTSDDEVGILGYDGGELRIVATKTGAQFSDLLRLSEDGSKLLLTPSSYLIDTATGDKRQLAAVTPGADPHTALLAEGMPRASMTADATRFVYAMRTSRCADCPNLPEQLATLDIDPADLGDAPTISDVTADPDEVPIDGSAAAAGTAAIDTEGEVVAAGVVALLDGMRDVNVGFDCRLADDGANGDTRANDGTYTFTNFAYSASVTRDDDTGPRILRTEAEIETPDGLRHATALDGGTVTVVAS